MGQTPFDSFPEMRRTFASGLEGLLQQPGLGSYILVHANACFDEEIHQSLRAQLRLRFDQHAKYCRLTLSEGRELAGAGEDSLVFLKLMAIGFDGVQAAEFRQQAGWELQFNLLRAFRPSRMSAETVTGISRPFNPDGFHFNKPFLRKEAFWSGVLQGVEVELLYNKFPFVPMHALLVPDRSLRLPQLLMRKYHETIWALAEQVGGPLPGIGIAYNSYGAYASVNHLHFQVYVRSEPLPLMQGHWRHNGGDRDYPLNCEVYRSAEQAWQRIKSLHASNTSYNLIYRPGELYCLPRKRQGSYDHEPWTRGFAWYELAGGFTTFSRSDFTALDGDAITRELGKLQPESADSGSI
jgi:diadenosine tetraphosphate (Ap4A) HIT family hydrolase